ncbi:Dof zinc finger protein DOF2.4 [Camellia lanceoleosa]|uniref:Dof zinc finger protein DOF2.4 n=1 Tax=Camellia lanceoleosa TaxID=1840588 RepID=A0ACC0HQQ8_9ERIC|nr:Dof zinc finger protein DOF2.4 [Camellia lanceoleosa]
MANIPMPVALKCPRCESTNTKFCYFNNYNLTRLGTFARLAGILDKRRCSGIPVGDGCRRNKRSKGSNSSKSPVSGGGGDGQTSSGSTSAISSSTSVGTASLLGLTPEIPRLRFMAAPLSQLTDHHHHHYGEIGLNYSGISAPLVVTSDMYMNFHLGSCSLGLGGGGGGGSGIEQWRLQQPT